MGAHTSVWGRLAQCDPRRPSPYAHDYFTVVPLRLERHDFKVGNQLVYTKGKLREATIRKGTITKVTARYRTSRVVGAGEVEEGVSTVP